MDDLNEWIEGYLVNIKDHLLEVEILSEDSGIKFELISEINDCEGDFRLISINKTFNATVGDDEFQWSKVKYDIIPLLLMINTEYNINILSTYNKVDGREQFSVDEMVNLDEKDLLYMWIFLSKGKS